MTNSAYKLKHVFYLFVTHQLCLSSSLTFVLSLSVIMHFARARHVLHTGIHFTSRQTLDVHPICYNVGSASQTVGQHYTNIGSAAMRHTLPANNNSPNKKYSEEFRSHPRHHQRRQWEKTKMCPIYKKQLSFCNVNVVGTDQLKPSTC